MFRRFTGAPSQSDTVPRHARLRLQGPRRWPVSVARRSPSPTWPATAGRCRLIPRRPSPTTPRAETRNWHGSRINYRTDSSGTSTKSHETGAVDGRRLQTIDFGASARGRVRKGFACNTRCAGHHAVRRASSRRSSSSDKVRSAAVGSSSCSMSRGTSDHCSCSAAIG